MRHSFTSCFIALSVAALCLGACNSDPKKSGDEGTAGTGGTSASGYPSGPYGNAVGNVIENKTFTGVIHPEASAYKVEGADIKSIQLEDFYNPTGDSSKPLVLLVTASARWCPSCKEEAKEAQAKWEEWHPQGVEFLTLIFEDPNFNAATTTDMMLWADAYNLTYPIAIDPKLVGLNGFFDPNAAPFNMVIDLRTMKITYGDVGQFFPSGGAAELTKALGK